MGYSLTIGEFETTVEVDGLHKYTYNGAKNVTLSHAPAYGEPTDYTNKRWPSYTSWDGAMRFVGLYDFMYSDKNGLLRKHPGCVRLTKTHQVKINKAYKAFYEKYPKCVPGFSPKTQEDILAEDKDWPEENMWAVRLEWLKFWVDWALENCDKPVFHNL